jgi:hypothetical protein
MKIPNPVELSSYNLSIYLIFVSIYSVHSMNSHGKMACIVSSKPINMAAKAK